MSGGGQSRRVVDAVTDHGHHMSFRAQSAHHVELVFGQDLGAPLRDAEFGSDSLRCVGVIAGHHDDLAYSLGCEGFYDILGFRA